MKIIGFSAIEDTPLHRTKILAFYARATSQRTGSLRFYCRLATALVRRQGGKAQLLNSSKKVVDHSKNISPATPVSA